MEKNIILLSLVPNMLMDEFEEQLKSAGGGREILISSKAEEIESVLDRVEIGLGEIPAALIPRMPGFKWWQLWSAGADVLQRIPQLKELPFQMTTAVGIHGQQIAEHVFAMLLCWNRRLKELLEAQGRREWLILKDAQVSILERKTMLILGYGAVGEAVARAALAFGMKVIGLRRNPGKGGSVPGVLLDAADKLKSYLPQTDIVVNILPATPDTKHYVGAAEFGSMKSSAVYINVGRGITTCETEMIAALREKRIAAALLDVTETEPLQADSPLWNMNNVIIAGHNAGRHPDYSRMAMAIALENLGRYNRGGPLRNLVDKQAGY